MSEPTRQDYERAAEVAHGLARLMKFNRDGFHPDATERRQVWDDRATACVRIAAFLSAAAERMTPDDVPGQPGAWDSDIPTNSLPKPPKETP